MQVRNRIGGVALLLALPLLGVVGPAGASPPGPADGPATGPATGRSVAVAADERPARGILARIRGLDIVTRAGRDPDQPSGPYRSFDIRVALPVDHEAPGGPTFALRLTLLHRSTTAPTVLHTSGYYRWLGTTRAEPTRIVKGNQIDLEHRFFRPSRPRDPDWHTQLTIEQAAADQHRVIEAFDDLYRGAWLTTGASKGGMTAAYHRHLYPDDVDGTVAYVAPNDADDEEDSAYQQFLASVGGPALADCRADLVAVQRAVLRRRAWFEARLRREWGASEFDTIGGVGRALEVGLQSMYWGFWQYDGQRSCRHVPGSDATRRDLWRFSGLAFGGAPTDDGIRPFLPYYFQAATQLGYPEPYVAPIADLVRYPAADTAAAHVPGKLHPLTFDPTAMAGVDQWVRSEATEMLFVNGEHDPWTAEPFDCGTDADGRDCAVLTAPRANHGASIRDLPPAERAAAVARVRSWAGLPSASARQLLGPAGEEWIPGLDDPWLEWVRGGRREGTLLP